MRGRKTVINTLMGLVEELAAIIAAFILPRLILSEFGSTYNGLITSITQFLQCAVLLRCGIGGATRAALYKPLAEKDRVAISAIINATDRFMKKIGLILAGAIVAFAAVYPFLVIDEFDWYFSFTLFLIIGVSTFAESFFGITYMILLQADQMLWISSLLRTVCYVLNLIISVVLIKTGNSIHVVKLGSALVYVMYPIVLRWYIRKKYEIESKVPPNNASISQRWDAFWHQFSLFIMDNTDVIVLTAFTNMSEVSVYSVYNLIVYGIRRLVLAFSSGLEAAFGNMLAKKEKTAVSENLSVIETLLFCISTVVYTASFMLILSFVRIYTSGIHDANYLRPGFAYILLVAQFFYCIRLPYQIVVQAAGKYKETKKYAIVEPVLNVVISVVLVIRFGLIGVAVGTLAASMYKTIMFSNYMTENIVSSKKGIMPFKCLISFAEAVVSILIWNVLSLNMPNSYGEWIITAMIGTGITAGTVLLFSCIFFREDIYMIVKKIRGIVKQ